MYFQNQAVGGHTASDEKSTGPFVRILRFCGWPDGQISADELQRCLTNSGISGSNPFNLETCRLMINMLDRDFSGTMGFDEFKELWGVLNQWKTLT